MDPQGQGKIWLRTKEQYNEMQVTNLKHKYFRTHLEDSLSLGRPLLIADVGEELDPILDNLLDRNFIKQGKAIKVMLGDREMDITDYNVFLHNPLHVIPELKKLELTGIKSKILHDILLEVRYELSD